MQRFTLVMLGALTMTGSALAQTSTICRFDQGPLRGTTHDYAPLAPLPIGTPCQDGAGSVGQVVGGNRPDSDTGSSSQGGGSPYGGVQQGQRMSSVCHFTSGPRTGGNQDYAPRPAVAVGSPCFDGAGSYGVVQ